MSKSKKSGDKYRRKIVQSMAGTRHNQSVTVDVYDVIEAFDVRSPARQHALKKLLCAGLRGKGDESQDITEAIDALRRDLQLIEANRITPTSAESPTEPTNQPSTRGPLVRGDLIRPAGVLLDPDVETAFQMAERMRSAKARVDDPTDDTTADIEVIEAATERCVQCGETVDDCNCASPSYVPQAEFDRLVEQSRKKRNSTKST